MIQYKVYCKTKAAMLAKRPIISLGQYPFMQYLIPLKAILQE